MKIVLDLLKPRLWPLLHRRPAGSTRQYVRLAVVTTVAGALWIGVFMVSLRVLTHFSTIEQIGALLNYKLLNMLMVTALALLVWLIAALSMQAPRKLGSYIHKLGRVESGDVERIRRELAALEGVAEAVVVPGDGVAYLKVDRQVFDAATLPGSGGQP